MTAKTIPLAFAGQSRVHTSCVANIAKLARIALDRPGTRLLNIADPEALSVNEIGTTIARHLGFGGHFVPVEGNSFPAEIGRTPWSVPRPFVLDNSTALAIRYRPTTDYPAAAGAICNDLAGHDPARDWKAHFPILANYP